MKIQRIFLSPFALPIIFFALCIMAGASLLVHSVTLDGKELNFLDAVFTATSATCVTGLVVVDTGSFFSRYGQTIILVLMQIGGLGVMTFTSLGFYLLTKRVSLTDRLAVSQSLLHEPTFHLGRFLGQIVLAAFGIEIIGAICLFAIDPQTFHPFSAIFHTVSAFCNAGFSLFPDSLMAWQDNLAVNGIFMALIILGGLGFFVLLDLAGKRWIQLGNNGKNQTRSLTWQSRIVLVTTAWLIVCGALVFFLAEHWTSNANRDVGAQFLTALFQSVTSRTAGFNTVDIGSMTNISLVFLCLLMWIGGSPGSCAGGIKTTTFRAMLSFSWSQIRGRKQTVVSGFALDRGTMQKVLALVIVSSLVLALATLVLVITEGGAVSHLESRGRFLEILFEVISAFGTVGLSTGLTASLSSPGKAVVILLMFVGRLGPILFIALLQDVQKKESFAWPEKTILVG
ncbi:MAG: potassium transporter TrkH [Deltaproteobacteria bacterium]|nr:potassium transporter TrkH [Deltaproteobacteria bacterium]